MRTPLIPPILTLMVVGCDEPEPSDYGARLAALEAAELDERLSTLEQQLLTLQAADATCQADVATLTARVDELTDELGAVAARAPEGEAMFATVDDVAAEKAAREAADAALQSALTSEEAARSSGDAALHSALTSEAATRLADDTLLYSALATETSARVSADAILTADVSDLDGRLSAIEADYLTESDVEDVVRTIGDLDVTVTDATELLDTLADLDRVHIASDATVTITLAAGSYDFYAPLELHHPDGGRVRIQGDPAATSPPALNFWGCDGVIVGEGSAVGYLGSLSLNGDGTAADGLLVHDSSTLTVGSLVIDGFGDEGIEVNTGSTLLAESDSTTVTVESIGGVGVAVVAESYAYLPVLTVDGTGSDGVSIEYGSSAWLYGAEIVNAGDDGLIVSAGSYANAYQASVNTAVGSGVRAAEGSFIQANYATTYDIDDGFVAGNHSGMDADYASATIVASGHHYGFVAGEGSALTAYDSAVSGGSYAYSSQGSYIDARYATITGASYGYWSRFNGFIHGYASTAAGVQTADTDTDVSNFVFGQ